MNKTEAIQAMKEGKKLTHTYFTDDEWVTIKNNLYHFEDGNYYTSQEFWHFRKDNDWNDGWSLK